MKKFKDVFIDFNIYNNPKILEEYIEKFEKESDGSVEIRYNIILRNNNINDIKTFDSIKKVIDIFKKNNILKVNYTFRIFDKPLTYRQKTWKKIDKLETFFKSAHIDFGFQDGGILWGINEVKSTVNAIKETVNIISSKDFSPLEMLLSAYFETTKFKYTPEEKWEHGSQSRSIYGVLNSDKIVCVGYSRLLEAILSKLDNKNIKVFQNTVQLSEGRHSNLIIYIKDKKYNLDGYYFFDPTADSVKEKDKYSMSLTSFLIPLKDIKFMNIYQNTDFITKEYINQMDKNKTREIGDEHRRYNMFEGQISFANDNYVFDNSFLKSFLSKPVHKNTTNDLIDINLKNKLNEKLDELNKLIDEKKVFDENIDAIKKLFLDNDIKYIAVSDLRKIIAEQQFSNINIEDLKEKQTKYKNFSLESTIERIMYVDEIKLQLLENNISNLLKFEELRKQNIEIEELTIKNAKETLDYLGTPLTLKKLKHCLKVYFEKLDFSKEEIDEIVNQIIEVNVFKASKFYREGATNCFYQEYQKNKNAISTQSKEVIK